MKYAGTRYNSVWDCSTWMIIVLVVAFSIWPAFLDDSVLFIVLTTLFLGFILATLLGIYYRIDGNNLVIYQFFTPTAYPIDKISEIKPTSSILSAPATSLRQRIAIKFADKSVLKSTMPLIISPVRQEEFIKQLLAVNPHINVKSNSRT